MTASVLSLRPLCGLVLLLLVLTGCTSSEQVLEAGADPSPVDSTVTAQDTGENEPAEDGAVTEIQVTLFGGPAEIAGYESLVASFEADNPDVQVVLNPVAKQDDLLANLTTAFAGGQPPDVFLVNYLKYGQFASQGVLADVQPYLDESDVIAESDFATPPLEAFRFDGQTLTCMPQNISSLEVYYNVDAFQAADLEPPSEGWTWDDFLTAARALTDPDTGTYGVGVEPSLQRIAPFVWSNGGAVVDDELAPTTLAFTEGPGLEALNFFLDLQLTEGVVPPDAQEQSLASEERFIAGQLGMYLNSRKSVPTLREGISSFTWDVGPMPTAPGGTPTTVLHGDAYCLPAEANPDIAWRFVEHAMSVTGQEILAASGRTVPSRLDVASSPVFLEPDQPPASAQVFIDAIPTIRSLPHVASWSQMQKQVDSILGDVFYGRIDRQQGIADMLSTATAVFAQGTQ